MLLSNSGVALPFFIALAALCLSAISFFSFFFLPMHINMDTGCYRGIVGSVAGSDPGVSYVLPVLVWVSSSFLPPPRINPTLGGSTTLNWL